MRGFYRADDGRNLQPAFQRAIDAAQGQGASGVFNDFGAVTREMGCPAPAIIDGGFRAPG